MQLQARDIAILSALSRYYLLSRPQIQRLCFRTVGSDPSSRVTRRRLQVLVTDGFITRHRLYPFSDALGSPMPVYTLAKKGRDFLAAHLDDDQIHCCNVQSPQPYNLLHWLAIGDTHIKLDEAVAGQSEVTLDAWVNEWEIVNKDASKPEERFTLFTLLREQPKRLVCAPDAAFILSLRGHRKVFYLEQDRGTSGIHQIAASKTPGYAQMLLQQTHRQHFPTTTLPTFTVLMVVPDPRRREALRKVVRPQPGAGEWRFVADSELTAESFLKAPIFYPCEGEPKPLIKTEAAP